MSAWPPKQIPIKEETMDFGSNEGHVPPEAEALFTYDKSMTRTRTECIDANVPTVWKGQNHWMRVRCQSRCAPIHRMDELTDRK